MSALQQQKCAEASAQLRQAEKALSKRSFFRGSPDYLAAAPLLEKAGELFRLGGDFDASKGAFKRCAQAQEQNHLLFRAAQAWENVAKTVLQQLKAERASATSLEHRTTEARQAYEKASGLYVDMSDFGKAADVLVKGAEACESHGACVDDTLSFYLRACELLEAQDKPHFAVETFRKTLSFMVKSGKYGDALVLLDRMKALYEAMEQSHNVHKCHLSQVILYLARGDVPAADALYSRCLQDDSFLSSNDCALAEDLVRAFKMGNEELLHVTVRKPGFLALDNQIGRLCRKLSVCGSDGAAPSQPQHQHRPKQARTHASKQRNPFAPSKRSESAQPHSFAPSTRPVAPVQGSEYESAAPTASGTEVRDSEYEAALAEALGEVDVSTKRKKKSSLSTPQEPETKSALSPPLLSSPPPAAARASARMDYELDDLQFAMPDSDALQFSLNETATEDVASHEVTTASARTKVAKATDDDFDLT
ncbi:hypothetical protein PsorP6_003448 [Peronosclerospora sorghi]|uniref:Uncharacterized protein n=1 Tax=Peronosclerospora sorghi TaxID=230839 RepID=A0ACC0VIU6_9STRA|nr:hypothetical protein PsorP6_003448 [Peronosclerospora sorghi]